MFELRAPEESPFAPQMFGNAGRDHMEKYGSRPEHYVWIGWKNHKHSDEQPVRRVPPTPIGRSMRRPGSHPATAFVFGIYATGTLWPFTGAKLCHAQKPPPLGLAGVKSGASAGSVGGVTGC